MSHKAFSNFRFNSFKISTLSLSTLPSGMFAVVVSAFFIAVMLLSSNVAVAQDVANSELAPMPEGHMSPNEFILNTIQFLCMSLIVYFLMVINPGKTRDENHRKFLEELKESDLVVTSSGILGKVAKVKPDGTVKVEIANNVKIAVDSKHVHPRVAPKAKA